LNPEFQIPTNSSTKTTTLPSQSCKKKKTQQPHKQTHTNNFRNKTTPQATVRKIQTLNTPSSTINHPTEKIHTQKVIQTEKAMKQKEKRTKKLLTCLLGFRGADSVIRQPLREKKLEKYEKKRRRSERKQEQK